MKASIKIDEFRRMKASTEDFPTNPEKEGEPINLAMKRTPRCFRCGRLQRGGAPIENESETSGARGEWRSVCEEEGCVTTKEFRIMPTPAQQALVAEIEARAKAAGADVAAIYAQATDRAIKKVLGGLEEDFFARQIDGRPGARPVGILNQKKGG